MTTVFIFFCFQTWTFFIQINTVLGYLTDFITKNFAFSRLNGHFNVQSISHSSQILGFKFFVYKNQSVTVVKIVNFELYWTPWATSEGNKFSIFSSQKSNSDFWFAKNFLYPYHPHRKSTDWDLKYLYQIKNLFTWV